jgi:hypothetical protein
MQQPARAPLRLLVVTDGKTIPNWLRQCLAALERSGAADVLLLSAGTRHRRAEHWAGVPLRQLLFRLYRYADRRLFRKTPDALEPIALNQAFPQRPLCRPAELLAGDARTDVVLDPLSLLPDERLAQRSSYGVWRIVFGRDRDPRTQAAPAFWEVVEGQPTTETRVCVHWNGGPGTLALYLSVAPTDRRSPSRGQNLIYWRLSGALSRMLQELWRDPDTLCGRLRVARPIEVRPQSSRVPGNLATLRAGALLTRRYIADKWTHARYREQWALAFYRGAAEPLRLDRCRMLIPPKDLWWADPFPVQVGGDTYVFHEEMPLTTGKGVIVATVIDEQGYATSPLPVLEREYHLSYPFVFRWDGEYFMIPETGSARQVELYRCVGFPSRWRLERVLLAGVTARDPTLAFMSGTWWLFANIPADGAGSLEDLHLFYADTPLGPWTPHHGNPIKCDVRSARPAGRIFERQGQFYRPSQDGAPYYGHAVSVNRILRLDPETYEEQEVERITPSQPSRILGIHTLNRVGDMTVIDCLLQRRR